MATTPRTPRIVPASAVVLTAQEMTVRKLVSKGLIADRRKGQSYGQALMNGMVELKYRPNDSFFDASVEECMERLKCLVEEWSDIESTNLMDWLDRGGYRAAEEAYRLRKVMYEAKKETVEIGGIRHDIMFEEELPEAELETLKPHSELSPEHELEKIVEEIVLTEDKRYGAW